VGAADVEPAIALIGELASRSGVVTLIELHVVGVDGRGERRLTGAPCEGFAFQPSGGSQT
jgi:hypothetical protein